MPTGDIGAVIDTLEFDTINSADPAVAQVNASIYAVAYYHPGGSAYIKTFEINAAGQITDAVIDTLTLDTACYFRPNIIKVATGIFAIAYEGPDNDGWVKTVAIDSAGQITDTVVDSLEFDTVRATKPVICNVYGDYFAIAYRDNNNDGKLVIVQIDSAGAIPATITDSWVYDTVYCYEHDIIKVTDGIVAILYRDNISDGWVKTVGVSSSGIITESIIDSLQFEPGICTLPRVCKCLGTVFAVCWKDADDDGQVGTFQITSAGAISNARIDILEYEILAAYTSCPIHMGEGVVANSYQAGGADGWLKTVAIDSAGQITDTIIDSLEWDTHTGQSPFLFHVTGNIWAVAYTGQDADGFIKTFDIETPAVERPHHLAMMGIGP
ncbi:hypothetical protein ES702_06498 [subsurface metagenome]